MLAASYSLVTEGASFEPGHLSHMATITNLGMLFIFSVSAVVRTIT